MRLGLLLLLLAPAAARAQSAPPAEPPADTLGHVTVTATRLPVETHRAPARVTVLGRADVEAVGAQTVADLLEARSAVFLKRYGPDGLATASLRGGGASHTLVLLDGHRLSDPQLGQLDLSLLPAALVESAEVLHGAASGLYGTDAVGGVVALATPAGGRSRAVVRRGAFGERGASILASGRIPGTPVDVTLALDAARTRGDYLYTDSTAFDNATGTNGVTLPRANADSRQQAAYARLGARLGRHRLGAGLLATSADRGLFDYGASTEARQDDRALRMWADHAFAVGGFTVATGLDVQRASLRYQNPALGLDDTGHTRVAALQSRAARTARLGRGTLSASLSGRLGVATARHPSLTDEARETSASVAAGAVLDLGRILVAPNVRFDRATVPHDRALGTSGAVQALSPQLGASVQPLRWRGLRVKASAGRAFRAPTFNDRFWQPGGDPNLRPERGWTAEAGASLLAHPGRARLGAEATLFTSRLRDQIVWRPDSFADGFYWAPVNVGRTRTTGWELSAEARVPAGRLTAEARALWAHSAARDVTEPGTSSDGQPLIYIPDDQVKLDASLGWRALRAGVDLRHVSARPVSTDGSRSLAPFTLLGAHVEAAFAARQWRARLAAHAENLTDVVYSVTPRSPMPPRHLRVSLTLESR